MVHNLLPETLGPDVFQDFRKTIRYIQSLLHNPPCKHHHSPVIEHINVSARKYMTLLHRNIFTSIQVGFCHRMNSGQIRLCIQIREGKFLVFRAFLILELRLGHCEPILY